MRDINIAGRDVAVNNSNSDKQLTNFWLWIMGILGAVIATVVGAWILGILKI